MSKKFDINNLPDLKIRVANAEESERAINAFASLGFSTKHLAVKKPLFFFADNGKFLDYVVTEESYNKDCGRVTQEISLAELEALVAEKQGNGLSEIVGAFANDPEAAWMDREIDGKHYDHGIIDELSDLDFAVSLQYKLGGKFKLTNEAAAQKRYDAAINFIENADHLYCEGGGFSSMGYYHSDVEKALRIASGLPESQTNSNLVAQAPAMYAELEMIAANLPIINKHLPMNVVGIEGMISRINALLAAARGESQTKTVEP